VSDAAPEGALPAWARDPETIERVFLAAVGEGDAEGVDAAIRLMLAADPARAVQLWDSLKAGLALVDLMSIASGEADDATIRRVVARG
jgi:hypothetical protein